MKLKGFYFSFVLVSSQVDLPRSQSMLLISFYKSAVKWLQSNWQKKSWSFGPWQCRLRCSWLRWSCHRSCSRFEALEEAARESMFRSLLLPSIRQRIRSLDYDLASVCSTCFRLEPDHHLRTRSKRGCPFRGWRSCPLRCLRSWQASRACASGTSSPVRSCRWWSRWGEAWGMISCTPQLLKYFVYFFHLTSRQSYLGT